jgi:hypothetical protein
MPFDGSSISQELRILGGLREFFEDDDRWVQEMFSDGEGRACLIEALRLTRQRLNIRRDRARAYLTRAIRQHHRDGGLEFFNDCLCSGIEHFAIRSGSLTRWRPFTRLTVCPMRRRGQPATRHRPDRPPTALHTLSGALP